MQVLSRMMQELQTQKHAQDTSAYLPATPKRFPGLVTQLFNVN